MQDLRIEPAEEGKGRTFRAAMLAHVEADHLWSSGSGDTIRPVYAAIAAGHGEIGPFLANLRTGRKAIVGPERYGKSKGRQVEFLRSAGYSYVTQRHPEGVVCQIFLREVVQLDPGMVDPKNGIRFLCMPPAGSDPVAHWIAWLDRRTRAPLIPDPAFHQMLLDRCIKAGAVGGSARKLCYAYGVEDVGLSTPIAMLASHAGFEELLAETVETFYAAPEAAPVSEREAA